MLCGKMYYIGIDLGGTNIAAGIVTEEGKIVVKDSVPTLSERPTDEIVTDMANLSKKLVQSIVPVQLILKQER